ncbi:BON domain-containing protein [Chitinibacter sp. ZOR0017]|uniref:BON domain-containing protein n=1 Tax=Chitinibacter sp. ZOR0017 TaxID=1339254 RepID=UPI00069106C2|nr:BON domain-containing protein [Chitinibacter sp. ZOR0017]
MAVQLKRALTIGILAVSLGLSACVPLVVVGGVAMGAWIGSDPRPTKTITEDTSLGANISAKIIDEFKERAHVNVNTFNGQVLLTGEVPDAAAKARVEQLARSFSQTTRVFNDVVQAPPSSMADRLNDSQLSTRVKTAMLTNGGDAQAVHIQVITDRKVVYLLGMSSPQLADRAAQIAASVSGVERVVKLVQPLAPLPQ